MVSGRPMRLRRKAATTKLDRRRQRSRVAHLAREVYRCWGDSVVSAQAFEALAGPPRTWGPGRPGEERRWGGETWTFAVEGMWSGWVIDVTDVLV